MSILNSHQNGRHFLFYIMQASVSLADEILLATKTLRDMNMDGNSIPTNPGVASYEAQYWASMANGTGIKSLTGTYNGLAVRP
jgi:hypothetical protein